MQISEHKLARGRNRCVSLTIDEFRLDVILDARDVGKNRGDFRIVLDGVDETSSGLVTHFDLKDRSVELNDVRPNGIGLELIFVHLNEFQKEIQGRLLRSAVVLEYAVGPVVDHFRGEQLRKESKSTGCDRRTHSIPSLT